MPYDKLKNKWIQSHKKGINIAEHRKTLLIAKGKPLFRKYGIDRAVLFGSVSGGYCRKHSDIDLFVHPLTADSFWEFRREIEDALEMPVDLYTDSDDPVFIQKVIARGEVIYDSKTGI